MFISKKFKGEMKLPRIVERNDEAVVEAVETPKAEPEVVKKPAAKKKAAEKTNEEKNEE